MYQNLLIEAYKKAQNYEQDQQIAVDLDIPKQRISDFRKGKRYMSDEQAIFLAEKTKIAPELALIGCHVDRSKSVISKEVWERMAKKFSKYGLQMFSMGYGAIVMGYGMIQQSINNYALCMLC
ncbi:DUF3693 domain-containing protein [Vibrio sp. A1-b2]|uniref:DUF3693 domain-containing protein n=1 Tax=Vibrio sp. A1-b2 TaxID=2912248 RepID=UPI001F426E0A|nr:DUF3693 domain-containing protein [Vibrio sp. A1-b2]MCF7361398.1 DUF3693 domain-containing protein [Vibrio sp. A1-b2]